LTMRSLSRISWLANMRDPSPVLRRLEKTASRDTLSPGERAVFPTSAPPMSSGSCGICSASLNKGPRRGATFRLWWRSVSVKRPQAVLALLSLMVGAAVMSMLLNLYGGVRRKMTQEFRAYGANVVLAPGPTASFTPTPASVSSPAGRMKTADKPCHPERSEGSPQFSGTVGASSNNCGDSSPANNDGLRMTSSTSLDSPTGEGNQGWGATMDQAVMSLVHTFARQKRGVTALPVLYGVVRLERIPPNPRLPDFVNIVAVGTDLAGISRMNPGWRESPAMDYSRPLSLPLCAVGARIASLLHVASGDTVYFQPLTSYAGGRAEAGAKCRLASVIMTGESEDDQMFLPLEELQSVMGLTGKISLVQLRLDGGSGEIERSIQELSQALPGVDVRPIRQIVYSEGRVLGGIRWFLLSITALILVIILICLTATMTAMALERRKDVGVMKALGASELQVMRVFLAEGAALGVVGGCVGFFVGSFWAFGLAGHLFGVTLNVIWWTLPLVCALASLLALGAAVFLVRLVRSIQPAAVLKGE
jgi:putative ABC transport system permease protein